MAGKGKTESALGFMNILAEGLQDDDFISGDPDAFVWSNRRGRIAAIITTFFTKGGTVMMTVENDHPLWLLHQLQRKNKKIKCIFVPKIKNWSKGTPLGNSKLASTARTAMLTNLGRKYLGVDHKLLESNKGKLVDAPGLYAALSALKVLPSFKDEYSEHLAGLYKFGTGDPNEMFLSDDGTAVYYTGDDPFLHEDLFIVQDQMKKNGYQVAINTKNFVGVFIGDFGTKRIVAAHFPGGQDKLNSVSGTRIEADPTAHDGTNKKAMDRMETLEYVLRTDPDFIGMDSNTGETYDFSRHFIRRYQDAGYLDAVPDSGYECFKMRGMATDQPDKAAELMFCKLDRILYRVAKYNPTGTEQFAALYGNSEIAFELYPPTMTPVIEEARKQGVIDRLCRGSNWQNSVIPVADLSMPILAGKTVGDLVRCMYPRKNSPSDHPPVVGVFGLRV